MGRPGKVKTSLIINIDLTETEKILKKSNPSKIHAAFLENYKRMKISRKNLGC